MCLVRFSIFSLSMVHPRMGGQQMKNSFRNSAYQLTEKEIRYAISNSCSNRDAAAFLHVSYATFRQYAKQYYDHNTGKNLFDLLKSKRSRSVRRQNPDKLVDAILEGKKPYLHPSIVQATLIREGIVFEQCVYCGESERRLSDNKSCCIMAWKDGNHNNHKLENLEMVCYNHFFLYYGNLKPWNAYNRSLTKPEL